jgi:hypothetical protein
MKGQTVVLFNGTELGIVVRECELTKWIDEVLIFDRPAKVQVTGKAASRLKPMNGGPERVFSRVGTGIARVPGLCGQAAILRYMHQSGEHRLALVPPRMLLGA